MQKTRPNSNTVRISTSPETLTSRPKPAPAQKPGFAKVTGFLQFFQPSTTLNRTVLVRIQYFYEIVRLHFWNFIERSPTMMSPLPCYCPTLITSSLATFFKLGL
ncbi:MAG: hypothetical protein DSM106950_38395 [Stigonema ocellatum SAG 48.90 = DSM 106950]|nr:hypothetical protein [Stigonema ocellatum SAG 48.90 = DSM 106950]